LNVVKEINRNYLIGAKLPCYIIKASSTDFSRLNFLYPKTFFLAGFLQILLSTEFWWISWRSWHGRPTC